MEVENKKFKKKKESEINNAKLKIADKIIEENDTVESVEKVIVKKVKKLQKK